MVLSLHEQNYDFNSKNPQFHPVLCMVQKIKLRRDIMMPVIEENYDTEYCLDPEEVRQICLVKVRSICALIDSQQEAHQNGQHMIVYMSHFDWYKSMTVMISFD